MSKTIYLGSSDFVELRSQNLYYVDKTRFISQVLNSHSKVCLITRPRRFGKTLNLKMLQAFFDCDNDHGPLFDGLDVTADAHAMAQRGMYPTVFLTFKDMKDIDWARCQAAFKDLIGELYLQHEHQLNAHEVRGVELQRLQAYLAGNFETLGSEAALRLLTKLLHRASGQKVVLLIDEYDSPIHDGYQHGYQQEVVAFIRNFLGAALKDNYHLEMAVLTGILRVAKDSIFSGLNNLEVYGVLDQPFSDCFGFTEAEVHQLLADTQKLDLEHEVKRWYNGYLFGGTTVYNPWSILSAAKRPERHLQDHWIHTSGNELIRDLVLKSRIISALDLETLLQDRPLWREIQVSVALNALTPETVWSLLLFSGYLTIKARDPEHPDRYDLRIPNLEVHKFFQQTVRAWLNETTQSGLTPFLNSLVNEHWQELARRLAQLVRDTLSYHDTGGPESERIYHVFLLGLLTHLSDRYQVLSNQESGFGRYDLALIPHDPSNTGFVFELKRADGHALLDAATAALAQIQGREYCAALMRQGIQRIHCIGMAFSGKKVALATALVGQTAITHEAEVAADEIQIRRQLQFGTLVISSLAGGDFFINGQHQAKLAPFEIYALKHVAAGYLHIELVAPEFEMVSERVLLEPGQKLELNYKPKPL